MSLSVVNAVITRLDFPRPLAGSSRWRGRRDSVERSLAEESVRARLVRSRASRVLVMALWNHAGESRASYISLTS